MKKLRLEQRLIEEIEKTENVSSACERVGLSRNSFYRWMLTDPNFAEKVNLAMEMGNLSLCDLAHSKLVTNINKGDPRAIEFQLKNRDPRYKPKKPDTPEDSKLKPVDNICHGDLECEKDEKKEDEKENDEDEDVDSTDPTSPNDSKNPPLNQ